MTLICRNGEDVRRVVEERGFVIDVEELLILGFGAIMSNE